MIDYNPKPIDTSSIAIPKELAELIEKLAENNHDTWAKRRVADGWKWGPYRNDQKREHPDLVPYSRLSESEKEYDRATVTEVLKAIINFGFEIKPT